MVELHLLVILVEVDVAEVVHVLVFEVQFPVWGHDGVVVSRNRVVSLRGEDTLWA